LDLFVVILGILLAFQLDRFRESWQERRLEHRYLERLRNDLAADIAEFEANLSRIERRLAQVKLLEEAVRDPESVASHPGDFVRAIEKVTWRSFPTVTPYTYNELVTSGRMALLNSEQLRTGLAVYYSRLEDNKRLGLGEDDQDRFRNETVGLLSAAHLSAIEDATSHTLNVPDEEAVAIAREFASRSASHPWLTRLAKYQVMMRKLTSEHMNRAQALISEIDGALLGNA
jgi:uncharacterized protein YhaN